MAALARPSMRAWHARTFDMRALRRLAIWGGAATMALVVAVVAGYSDTSRRTMAAAGAPGNAQKTDVRGSRLDARSADLEAETQRLASAVRALTTDREQLIARIGTLERNLEDITGSIRRQEARQEPSRQDSPATAPPALAAAAPSPLSPSPARDAGIPAQPQPAPQRIANASTAAPDEAAEAKGEFGVDIGGAANFDGLRTLWASTKATNGMLFEDLYPAVAVRENNRKGAELRLIVGPLPDVEAAARLCAKLSGGRRYCQPVAFEGQRLPDVDAGGEPKPAVAPKPAPKPSTKSGARSSSPTAKFPRLF